MYPKSELYKPDEQQLPYRTKLKSIKTDFYCTDKKTTTAQSYKKTRTTMVGNSGR